MTDKDAIIYQLHNEEQHLQLLIQQASIHVGDGYYTQQIDATRNKIKKLEAKLSSLN